MTNYIRQVSRSIIEENLVLEKEYTQNKMNDNTPLISASMDARWDKRGSGRKYDSVSGAVVLIGNETGTVIAVETMSTICT